MLTKEHLKFRNRSGRAYPVFADVRDAGSMTTARDLVSLFEEASRTGMTFGEVEEAADGIGAGAPQLAGALTKLLLDACDEGPDDESIERARWEWLAAAEALRIREAPATAAEFQARLAAAVGESFVTVRDRLYGDLPACRRVAGFKTTTPEALLHRFNVAQVQGLLLRARSMQLKIKGASLGERRQLFRQLKFRRLLCEVRPGSDEGALELEVSGPLAIFDQASTYGLRLASFFPHVLHLPKWELTAEVHINRKDLTLKLDEKAGLVSHYRHSEPYLPEELLTFVDAFNARTQEWVAAPGGDFVHVGRESYCFPDLTITGCSGGKRHVELFHRWHAGQLVSRLQALDANPVSSLFIGVAKSLAGRKEVAAALAASRWFAKNGFVFSEFPTPKAVLGLLARA